MIDNYMGNPGLWTGLYDRNERRIHIGDTLEFDEQEWGGPETFVVEFEDGELTGSGCLSDWSEWCVIIKKWNEE